MREVLSWWGGFLVDVRWVSVACLGLVLATTIALFRHGQGLVLTLLASTAVAAAAGFLSVVAFIAAGGSSDGPGLLLLPFVFAVVYSVPGGVIGGVAFLLLCLMKNLGLFKP